MSHRGQSEHDDLFRSKNALADWLKERGVIDNFAVKAADTLYDKEFIAASTLLDVPFEVFVRNGVSDPIAIHLSKKLESPRKKQDEIIGLQSEMQAMRLEIHGVRETLPSVLVGHVITPSAASRMPQVVSTVFDALGLSIDPFNNVNKYTAPDSLGPKWKFSFKWLDNHTHDDRILERTSYEPVLSFLRGLQFLCEDVSEGQFCVEELLYNSDVYTCRNENPMTTRAQKVFLRHRVQGRTDIVVLNRERHGSRILRNMIKFAIEIKTVAGYKQSTSGCMREAQLQLIGLNAFNTNNSPPVILTNLANKHQVVYLDKDQEWRYLIRVQDCTTFAAAVHFANSTASNPSISHHFSRPTTPDMSE